MIIKNYLNLKNIFITFAFCMFFSIFFGVNSYALPDWHYSESNYLTELKATYPNHIILYDAMNSRYLFYGSSSAFTYTKDSYGVYIAPTDGTEFSVFDCRETGDWFVPYYPTATRLNVQNAEIVYASETIQYDGTVFFSPTTKALLTQMMKQIILQVGQITIVGITILSLMLLPTLLKKLWIFF